MHKYFTASSIACLVAAALLMAGPAVGDDTSLAGAQTRLRYAQEGLDRSKSDVKSQEKRLKEAEDSLARQQQKLDEQKGKVEKAKTDLADAKVKNEQAQKTFDDASAEIRRFYQERQQSAQPATKPN